MGETMWSRGIKIALTIVGTTIGAGFASGREIWEFFSSYGTVSHWGILLSMSLFSVCSMVILYISWKRGARNYHQVLVELMGPGLARWFDKLVFLFILSGVVVMFAGSGATVQQWKFSFWTGVIGMVFAVLFILFYDVKGLLSMNTVIMPILTCVLIYVCIRFLNVTPDLITGASVSPLPKTISDQWPSAITYASLNIVSLLAVLSTFGGEIERKEDIFIGGTVSVLLLGSIAFLLNKSLIKVGDEVIALYDIPLFSLIIGTHPIIMLLVTIILWLAIYTTAVSGVYGVAYRLSQRFSLPIWLIGLIVMVLLLPLTQFGFAELVNWLYPLYGIINLFILAMILLYPLKKDEHQNKKDTKVF
jgi:uncharacterized membrane protein YkvI